MTLKSWGRDDITLTNIESVPGRRVVEHFGLVSGSSYAAAHVMLMLGRYSRLILDSWTRPTYLRVAGKRSASDNAIKRRFRRYGRYAGLAFWLYITRDWVADEATPTPDPLNLPS